MSAVHRPVMNVLMTCSGDAGTGGVQQVFRDLIRALEAEGRRVILVYQAALPQARLTRGPNSWGRDAFYCAMPTLVNGSVVLGMLTLLIYLPITLFHLLRLMRRYGIGAINAHYLAESFLHLVIAGRLSGVPVIVSVHGADIDRYAVAGRAPRLLLRLVMRGATKVVACSAAMAAQTLETFPVVRGKVTHVHNGLDIAELASRPPAGPVRTPFVLSVARQVEKKGIDTLLRAFALLQHDFTDLSLVVIGDGPTLASNRALARTLGIDARVHFLGSLAPADVRPYLCACSVFVVPSRAEPFGLVVLEAAQYRKGLVCTRVGGIPEIITDNVSGLLVERDDAAGMAAGIATLLRDPALASRLGANAHDVLMQRFRWKDRVRDYIAVYEGA